MLGGHRLAAPDGFRELLHHQGFTGGQLPEDTPARLVADRPEQGAEREERGRRRAPQIRSLLPPRETNKQATLTIQSALTFNADATYTYTFKAKKKKARTDKVVANGVTINGASLFSKAPLRARSRGG
jgi:hypothetical protein